MSSDGWMNAVDTMEERYSQLANTSRPELVSTILSDFENDVEVTVLMIPHLSCTGRHVNVCFDIGGVLLVPNLNVTHGTALDPALFKRMMRSHAWCQYYDGKLSWCEAVRRLSLEYGVEEEDIRTFVDRARASLVAVPEMVRLVESLSATQKLKLYCMSNASAEDYDHIVTAFPDLFRHFERVFYSAAVGSSKPNLGIFHHFVHETGCKPSETIFLDDTLQNVVAAEIVGFSSVLVKPESVSDAVDLTVFHLRTEDERHAAAWEYILNRRKRGGPVESCPSLTSDGLRIHVQYDHFVIAELLHDPSFLPVHEVPATGTFNFFPPFEKDIDSNGSSNGVPDKIKDYSVTQKNFPDDLDTTAVAMSALYNFSKINMAAVEPVLEKMLATVTEDGLFGVYFDPLRPRVDHVVQAIICHLFHLVDLSGAVQKVEATLRKVLKRRAYLLGSLYYPLPEAFLWRVARLAYCRSAGRSSAHDRELEAFQKLVAKRVEERVGMPGSPLALAMRVLACEFCGINSSRDRKTLARMQKADGSWALCPFYKFHNPKSWVGNEVTSTAFAVAALRPSNLLNQKHCSK